MDSKFYVSLEVARLLREKGYDKECITYYHDDCREVDYSFCGERNSTWEERCVSAPTKAEAIDWLESNTGFIISEDRRCDGFWYYVIFQGNDIYYDSDCFVDGSFLTRWEAEDAAIIKVCEML